MRAPRTSKQIATSEAESALIREIRRQAAPSRVQLARRLSLAPSTVGVYVDRLIGEGYLREGRRILGGSGRPATIVELNPKAGEFIGVDFHARLIAATSVDFSQKVQQQSQKAVHLQDRANDVLAKIEAAIAELAHPSRLLGIGVAVPGTVDSEQGIARHYEHIPDWQEVPLVEMLTKRFKVPVYLENNIRSFALAEQWFGQRTAVKSFVCLGIRSGVGAGVVIDGQLHRGADGLAGEIGSWPCIIKGDDAEFGNATLEQVASVRAILSRINEGLQRGVTSSDTAQRGEVTLDELLQGAHASDPLILKSLQIAAEAVAGVIAQISLLLNPERVVIAGPLAELQEEFLAPLSQAVEQYAIPHHARTPEIVAASLGEYGGALGAAAMAVHAWHPS